MNDILLNQWFSATDLLTISHLLDKAYGSNLHVYPQRALALAAFSYFSPADTRVIIVGQDPYHGQGQAMGLSFSVPQGVKTPPSLRNILKELNSDLNITYDTGDLTGWAKQGVLLLNTHLTVEEGKPGSHSKIGWDSVTRAALAKVSQTASGFTVILWGAHAWQMESLFSNSNSLIIKSAHPSPLSAYRGFFGSKPFSRANEFLTLNNKPVIKWAC